MSAPTAAPMTAFELTTRLRRHYINPAEPLPGGVFLNEVTMNGQGGRRADALYVGFTRSRGTHLIGHEVKVHRADWLNELDALFKADVWASQCHAWYAVAPSTAIIRPEELPHGWGLLVPSSNPRRTSRLDVVVRADLHPERQPSWTAVLSILKRADTLRANTVSEIRSGARDVERAEFNARVDAEVERRVASAGNAQTVEDLRARLAAIEGALGAPVVTDRTWTRDDAEVLLGDLSEVAALARTYGGVREAAGRIVNRYAGHELTRLRAALDEVGTALDDVRTAYAKETTR